jgi:hypothetical protein
MNDRDFVSEERELSRAIQQILREGGLENSELPNLFTLHRAKTNVRGYILTTDNAARTVLENVPCFASLRSYNHVWILLRDDALKIIKASR